MKQVIAVIALLFLLVAGSASVAAQLDNTSPEEHRNETVEDELEELREDAEERRETLENRFENQLEEEEERPERSARFEARLMIAITSIEHLLDIAPDQKSEERLQDALESLKKVQGDNELERSENQATSTSDELREDAENNSGEDEEQKPSEDTGPTQNQNRPGFVRKMLGGIFG